jgi:squalene-hopene/tetraprenyl-beta-curcumene cyclase
MSSRCAFRFISLACVFVAGFTLLTHEECLGQTAAAQATSKLTETRTKAINYLKTSQSDDGSWTTANAPGVTGLVLTGLLRSGVPASDLTVAKGLKFLEGFVQPDGGIYFPKSNHRNYESCVALLAFAEANQDGKYTKLIAGVDKFLRQQQWDAEEGKKEDDPEFGGAGYGSKSRPDLSNTQFLIDALRAAGAKSDDPALKKALIFVSRTQNLESESNNTPFASKVNDGGFYYTPAAGGASFAAGDALPNGGLRSYASMTYAGLKSMIYCGVGPDDPRVKAAVAWIQKHYSVTENPGLGQTGAYYYYHTFAKALFALGQAEIADKDGTKHDWRAELVAHLTNQQKENGSWVNMTQRWNEGDPNLVTAYTLLALSYCDRPFEAAKK